MSLVIFDLDGVLVDACDWHYKAFNLALEEVCEFSIQRDEHEKTFNGLPTKKKLAILKEQGRIPDDLALHSLIEQKKQEYTMHIIKRRCKPSMQLLETIEALEEAGHTLACYTNCIRASAEMMLKKSGVLPHLTKVVTNEDVWSPKPNPEGYILLMNCLEYPPEDTYIVEDSEKGLIAARASQANVVQVANSKHVTIELFEKLGLLS